MKLAQNRKELKKLEKDFINGRIQAEEERQKRNYKNINNKEIKYY